MTVIPELHAQVTHRFSGTNLPHGGAVVYGVEQGLAESPLGVATTLHDIFGDRFLPSICADVNLISTLVKFGPNDTGPAAEFTLSRVGTSGPDAMAPQVSVLLSKQTGLGGRRGRGRMYLPGVEESAVDDAGILATAFASFLQGNATGFLVDLAAANLPMEILHSYPVVWSISPSGRPVSTPVPGPLPEPTPVTGLSVSARVATQRRRNR